VLSFKIPKFQTTAEDESLHFNLPAFSHPNQISLSQFLVTSNPDAVSNDKIVLEDDWTGKRLTYGELRHNAERHAKGLGVGVADVVGVREVNSVSWQIES